MKDHKVREFKEDLVKLAKKFKDTQQLGERLGGRVVKFLHENTHWVQPAIRDSKLIKPCPFCNHKLDIEDHESLHPTFTVWKYIEEIQCNAYKTLGGFVDEDGKSNHDGQCWVISCVFSQGGCGAQIVSDSEEEAIESWNTRF